MLLSVPFIPSSGSFPGLEKEQDENRKRIGAILEHPIFYPYLSGAQNLRITARIKGVPEKDVDRVCRSWSSVPERTALLLPIHWA